MKKISIFFVSMMLVIFLSLSAQPATLIAGNTNGDIDLLDTVADTQTFMYNIGFGATGLAVDDLKGILYASGGAGWGSLSAFNLATGTALQTPIASGYGEAYGAEFVYDNGVGRLFSLGMSGGVNHLIEYSLNLDGTIAGVLSAIPILDITDPQNPKNIGTSMGLAYDVVEGKFHFNRADNMFYELNMDGTAVALFGLGLTSAHGLAFQDGLTYSITAGGYANCVVSYDFHNTPHQIPEITNPPASPHWALSGTTTPIIGVIPEPGLLSMVLAGIFCLVFLRRRS